MRGSQTGRGLSEVLALAASPDPFGPLLAGTRAGLRMSRDGGLVWAPVPTVPGDVAVTAVAYHASDPQVLLRSRNGGSSWEPTGLLAEPQTVVTALAVGPGDQVVVATTAGDILRSKDAGRT